MHYCTIIRGNTVLYFIKLFSCPSARALRSLAQTPYKIHGRSRITYEQIRQTLLNTRCTIVHDHDVLIDEVHFPEGGKM